MQYGKWISHPLSRPVCRLATGILGTCFWSAACQGSRSPLQLRLSDWWFLAIHYFTTTLKPEVVPDVQNGQNRQKRFSFHIFHAMQASGTNNISLYAKLTCTESKFSNAINGHPSECRRVPHTMPIFLPQYYHFKLIYLSFFTINYYETFPDQSTVHLLSRRNQLNVYLDSTWFFVI